MDRIETAELYLRKFSELAPAKTARKMYPTSDGQGFILAYLHKHNGMTVCSGDLAKASCVSTARIAATLKNLETLGLVQRAACEEDSRKTIVSLTPQGEEKAKAMKKDLLEHLATIVEAVGQEDMDEYLRISQKIKDAIEGEKEEERENV